MRNQSVRLFLYSSLSIVALTLVWGLKQVPRQGEMADDQLRQSLQQEMALLRGAVRSATSALKFRLLDVLKAEGNDRSNRALQDSVFDASALIEWDGSQWKIPWHISKLKNELSTETLSQWMKEWPLAKINAEDAYFARVGEFEGQPHFVLIVPIRRANNTPTLGVGLFPASEFGLAIPADHIREVRVFDNKGYALALGRPAYLGTSIKQEPVVAEILDSDTLSLQQEWRSEKGTPTLALAVRMADSNLFATVESPLSLPKQGLVASWIYLVLCSLGAIGMNWALFASMVQPLLKELEASELTNEKLRRFVVEPPVPTAILEPRAKTEENPKFIPSGELPSVDFLESAPSTAEPPEALPATSVSEEPSVPLSKVVDAALRALDTLVREAGLSINRIGLGEVQVGADFLQLQTAFEEVIKNAIEAMQDVSQRQITFAAHVTGGRVRLAIEDTGSGITPEDMAHVFDPFFSTRKSSGVSRGLGLNVVRRVMEDLKGFVEVHNRVDVSGTSVVLEWPLNGSTPEVVKESVVPASSPIDMQPPSFAAEGIGSEARQDLDFLDTNDEDENGFRPGPRPSSTRRLDLPIRKPKVRTLD